MRFWQHSLIDICEKMLRFLKGIPVQEPNGEEKVEGQNRLPTRVPLLPTLPVCAFTED